MSKLKKETAPKDNEFRICFMGYTTVGKTCLVLRWLNDEYEEMDDPTLEDSHRKELTIDGDRVILDILDTGGAEEHHYLHDKWLGWADGVVFVYNCHSAYSFDMIPRYRNEMAKVKGTKEFPVVLVANQVEGDESTWEITSKEGRSVAYTYRCPFVEASAKEGSGVDNIFTNIIKEIKEKRKAAAFDALSAPQKKKTKSATPVQRVMVADAKKIGTLQTKATVKPFKSAKKAWIALKDGVVYLYQKEKDIDEGVPAIALNLLTCTVKPKYGDKKLKNCFELISLKSQFQFMAESQEEMMDWITAIQEGIAYMLNENTADKSKLKGQEDRGNLQTWEELKKQPENCVCVDCGAADPDWISINLGLMMCIQCSGVHRSMGVHISKVRSITLDELEAEVQELMKALGNRMVNSLWERGLAQSGKRKPSTNDDRPTKEKFIRAKYAQREFVVKENIDANALGLRLYEAAGQNNLEAILACVSQGVDINWTNSSDRSRTSLHNAASQGHGIACLMLLLNSAEPNVADADGQTPLALCSSASCADVLKRNGSTGEAKVKDCSSSGSGAAVTPSSSSSSIPTTSPRQSPAVAQALSSSSTSSPIKSTSPASESSSSNTPPLARGNTSPALGDTLNHKSSRAESSAGPAQRSGSIINPLTPAASSPTQSPRTPPPPIPLRQSSPAATSLSPTPLGRPAPPGRPPRSLGNSSTDRP